MLKFLLIGILGLTLMGCQTISGSKYNNNWRTSNSISTSFADGPRGAQNFCKKHPDQCKIKSGKSGSLETIKQINRHVNSSIRPVNDSGDSWDIKQLAGDCEDYVLEKRRLLLQKGWASKNVQVAIGTLKGEYHAVLIVDGRYVLDNLTNQVTTVSTTKVNLFMIQTEEDPKKWRLML